MRDVDHQAHYNKGAHSALDASGGHDNHIREGHDKGFYEREKKYGYEKAYGYERETKHHDKGDKAHSHGSKYHHSENKGHYDQGSQSHKEHDSHGNKYNRGSQSHGDKDILIDISDDHHRGKDIDSGYRDDYDDHHHQFRGDGIPRRIPPRRVFLQRYIPDLDDSLDRFRYMSGIHGLGGLRMNDARYRDNPLRYGYRPRINAIPNQDQRYIRPIIN